MSILCYFLQHPSLNWSLVIANLDYEGFSVPDENSFSALVTMYRLVCEVSHYEYFEVSIPRCSFAVPFLSSLVSYKFVYWSLLLFSKWQSSLIKCMARDEASGCTPCMKTTE